MSDPFSVFLSDLNLSTQPDLLFWAVCCMFCLCLSQNQVWRGSGGLVRAVDADHSAGQGHSGDFAAALSDGGFLDSVDLAGLCGKKAVVLDGGDGDYRPVSGLSFH